MRSGKSRELRRSDTGDFETKARATPLGGTMDEYLLETAEGRHWKSIKKGKVRSIINAISQDNMGYFHGLGNLDKSIKLAKKSDSLYLKVSRSKRNIFKFSDTGKECAFQEILFHYFHIPISVIAEPSDWYAYKRKSALKEISKDKTTIRVAFEQININYGKFHGTCIYVKRDNIWKTYKIRPNQSGSIGSAETWLGW